MTFEEADTNSDNSLSEEELTALTIAQIRAIAAVLEYDLPSSGTKAEIIAAFLAAQTEAQTPSGNDTPGEGGNDTSGGTEPAVGG